MSVKVVYTVIFLLVYIFALGRAQKKCITPNGEEGSCVALPKCTVIRTAFFKHEEGIREFVKLSKCGADNQRLVCCGTTAKLIVRKPCTTPNGEPATCLPMPLCKIISDAVQTQNKDAIEFAEKSYCGNDQGQMVCCGSDAYPIRTNLLPNRSVCGENRAEVRIYGGDLTEIGEYPWMALLRYKNDDGTIAGFRCGGSLINERYVLTAAHCVEIAEYHTIHLDIVRLGEWRISTVDDCDEEILLSCADPVVDLKVEGKIVHPGYAHKNKTNDIALLRLEKNVNYTNYIKPICLPVSESPEPVPGANMFVAGWGATENSSESDYKLKVKIPIAQRSKCDNDLSGKSGIDERQLCAGGETGKDSCQGDSGGPLMQSYGGGINTNPKWFQEGLVSYGVVCGVPGYPAVYTRVAYYIDWIIENLKP